MPSQQEIDEILEDLWSKKEGNKGDICSCDGVVDIEEYKKFLLHMQNEGLVTIDGDNAVFTKKGEEKASALIRRHRLAERLLTDILDTSKEKIEGPACQFEHLVSEEVTEAICTLLGHPTVCPHGLPIPKGDCCVKAQNRLEALISSLDKIDIGEKVTVSYILAHHNP